MNDKQRRSYERGQRAYVYMNAATTDFPLGSRGGALRDSLQELLAQAAALDVARGASAGKRRQGTEGRVTARTTLRQMVKIAWDTYKTLTLDRPDIKGLFEPPSKIKNDQALVAAARAYADASVPHASLFAEYGLATAFFNDLRTQADRLEAQTALRDAGVGEGVNANAALDETLRRIDEEVERLDTVVRNRYRDDPAKLAEWESASRLEHAPRRKPKDDENAPPPPPPANG